MRLISSTYLLLALLMAGGSEAKAITSRQTGCDSYEVSGMSGAFTTRDFIDFSTALATDDTATVLAANNLYASAWPVTIDPAWLTHDFVQSNVALTNGALNLKVQAYAGSGNVKAAELATTFSFKYGSVRTYIKSSSVPGVCEGNFLYTNKYNEVDWEVLTSTIDTSSACVPQGIWATNQALTSSATKTSTVVPFPFDPRSGFHEYRIDWSATSTKFYLDGVLKATHTTNVPTLAGPWLWNVWSNGDPCWSAGPPTADSITQIRSIEIIRGHISAPAGTVCTV